MRRLAAITAAGALLVLGACATPFSTPPPEQQLLATCQAYADTLDALAVHRELGNLSDATIRRVDGARAILNPICGSPSPRTVDGEPLSLDRALSRAEAALIALQRANTEA